MPADTLTISLTGPLVEGVRAAAEAENLTPEEFVRKEIEEAVAIRAEAAELDWEEDIRRLEEPGENIPLDQAFDELRAKVVEARAQAKTK